MNEQELASTAYCAHTARRLLRAFAMPQNAISEEESAVIFFTILKRGVCKDVRVHAASASKEFVQAAENAVVGASPMRPIPFPEAGSLSVEATFRRNDVSVRVLNEPTQSMKEGPVLSREDQLRRAYCENIERRIDEGFICPQNATDESRVVLRFKVSDTGDGSVIRVQESSANSEFVQAAEKAITSHSLRRNPFGETIEATFRRNDVSVKLVDN